MSLADLSSRIVSLYRHPFDAVHALFAPVKIQVLVLEAPRAYAPLRGALRTALIALAIRTHILPYSDLFAKAARVIVSMDGSNLWPFGLLARKAK